ncbi:MAG: AsmA family protein [Kiloniellaceae bacterium]
MRIRIKWVATGLGALIVGALVTGYAVLATMDFEDLRGVIEAEAKKATGRDLTIAGPVDLQVSLAPAIALENVTFANAPWGVWPEMLSVRRIEVEVALVPLLSGDIQIRRLVLVEPVILLETGADGRGNWEIAGPAAEPAAKAAPALPAFHEVVVRDGRALYRDGETGEEVRFDLTELQARAEGRAGAIRLTLAGSYNGSAFKSHATLGSLDQLVGSGRFPIDLDVNAGVATLSVAGNVADLMTLRGIDVLVAAKGENLADLAAFVGRDLPALGPYRVAAQVKGQGSDYRLTGLTVEVGESDIAGSAAVSLGRARPDLSGTFTAGRLNLADFLPPAKEAPTPPDAPPQGDERRFVLPDDPWPLDGLREVDARAKLTVGRLQVHENLVLNDVDLAFVLEGGRLTISSFRAGYSGGRLAGDLRLDARHAAPPVAVNLTVSGLDYGRLLGELGVTDGVAGSLDAIVRLRGAGASLRALAATLGGRAELVGGEGRVRSDLLQASGAGLLDMVSAWREGDNDLRLNCVVGDLPIADGVVTAEAILIDTAAVTVGATGTLDLGEESLNLRLTPQAKHTSLMSLAVPVRVTGALAAPSVGPDPVGTAVGAAKIAGLIINPLAAGAAIILQSEMSDKNPCLAAMQATGRAADEAGPPQPEEKTVIDKAADEVTGAVEDAGEGITEGIQSLFGQ